MALAVDLYSSTVTLSLSDDSALGINWGGSVGMPGAERIMSQSWGRGYSPLAAIDYRERVVTLSVQVKASSLDNWIATFRQINTLLLDARLYYTTNGAQGDRLVLSVQLNGMTYPLEYDVLDGECDASALFESTLMNTTAPRLTVVPLTLQVKPWGRPQQLTRTTSASQVNGGGVSATNPGFAIAAPNGDFAAPAKVTFQSAAGDGFARVMIGKKTNITTAQFPFAVNLEVSTGPGYTVTIGTTDSAVSSTNAAVAGAHNASVGRIMWASNVTTNVYTWRNIEITSGLEAWRGKYRVYARIDDDAGGGTTAPKEVDYYRFSYGGTSGDAIALTATGSTAGNADWLIDLGVIEIPPRFGPMDVPTNTLKMRLGGSLNASATASGHLDLDALYFMPIGEGFFDGVLTGTASAQSQLAVDKLQLHPQAYLMDSSGDITSANQAVRPFTNTFFDITPGVNNVFYALYSCATNQIGNNLTDLYTLSADYYPQYTLGRTS